MNNHATTIYRLVLSCDPSEPMVLVGYGSEYMLPFEGNHEIISAAAFEEPVLVRSWADHILEKIVRELSELPRMLPFE